ncbi:MAG: hypothetical protein IKM74_00395 [Bacteroidales bacterium]|jgi:hypothetical protein|nr:hypothetical protein [Bacteroidales bacterium]MBR6846576.1 hypothetical protein [Bacteroidales bacterium]
MDIPIQAYGATVTEGKEYFFKSGCPIGVENHIHICIFKDNKVFLFATGSSQLEKAKRRAFFLHYDEKTYPIFTKNGINRFEKDTYVDCNKPIETTPEKFNELLSQGFVYELPGIIDSDGLSRIAEGVKSSDLVESRIKNLF